MANTTKTPAAPAETTPPAPAPEKAKIAPVKSVLRIDSVIMPDTMFVPDSAEQREELFALNAVVELDEAEAALAEKIAVLSYGELTVANDIARKRIIAEQEEKQLARDFAKKALLDAVKAVAPIAAASDDF
ncbi:hypothetical protein [Sphingobium lignivorans]|uniref:Uncharacterized protein n=1 Tax=Sphingobium lignivorans TaxID=2735886 RepID=A0ABR6NHC8_9SPHN|nr:hypothetical protein [Sphingobium lignivorans]MBB5985928.1 hypothetical protein [Sphingobium lignivorans]